MKLHEYKTYEEYKEVQTKGNIRKLKHVWIKEGTIAFISSYLSNRLGLVESGLCHGTRRGVEQEWFGNYLNADVLGTEISTTASQFPNTIEWDFHEVKVEWLDSFDFVYSNTLDHAYDPKKALRAWMSCVKPGGCLVLQWEKGHNRRSDKLDPFAATLGEYVDMLYDMNLNIDLIEKIPVDKQGWMIILSRGEHE